MLGDLRRGSIVEESQQRLILGMDVDLKAASATPQLLLCITDDPWWQSAWIFQEDYISNIRIWLLIRHYLALLRSDTKNQLGGLPGELVVNFADFQKYVT